MIYLETYFTWKLPLFIMGMPWWAREIPQGGAIEPIEMILLGLYSIYYTIWLSAII